MSNWPRNHADFSHPNWTARTTDRRAHLDWPSHHQDEDMGYIKLGLIAVVILTTFVTGFWLLDFLFG